MCSSFPYFNEGEKNRRLNDLSKIIQLKRGLSWDQHASLSSGFSLIPCINRDVNMHILILWNVRMPWIQQGNTLVNVSCEHCVKCLLVPSYNNHQVRFWKMYIITRKILLYFRTRTWSNVLLVQRRLTRRNISIN